LSVERVHALSFRRGSEPVVEHVGAEGLKAPDNLRWQTIRALGCADPNSKGFVGILGP